MNKKTLWLLSALIILAIALSGCFNANRNGGEPAATPVPNGAAQPGGTATPVPMTTPDMNNADPGSANAANAGYDWGTQAAAVEGRIGMFSEIQSARVVVCENTALVGVVFGSAYKGEMTQRIRDMIAGEVMAVDSSVQVVAVTSEPGDVEKINALAERQKNGASAQELKAEVDAIAKNATTLR